MANEKEHDSEKALHKAVWDSNDVLVSASTVLTPRPSTLTLTRIKLIAERKSGVAKIEVMSVQIEDVLNIGGSIGPFFGTVKIDTKFTKPSEPYTLGLFHRKDVINLKRIIQGYIMALQQHIDVTPLPTLELRDMLYDLGEDDHSIR